MRYKNNSRVTNLINARSDCTLKVLHRGSSECKKNLKNLKIIHKIE